MKIYSSRRINMYRIWFALLLFLLAACAPAQNLTASPLPTVTMTAIATPLPEAMATATTRFLPPSPTTEPPKIPCDPRVLDFCITDGHFLLQRPIYPSANDRVDPTYRYASTENGKREPHHGVEFLNKYGTPVHAAAEGRVVFAGLDVEAVYSPWANFYGNLIVLKHENDLYTLYAHLSKIDVQAGDKVFVGAKIGEVGQSGVATGSHLHFEVRRGDVKNYFATRNPELWLALKSDGALMISVVNAEAQYQFAELTIAHYLGTSNQPEMTYFLDTYVNEMAKGDENAALGDLPEGRYRIALKYNGHIYERWVEVESGKLTQTIIVVK